MLLAAALLLSWIPQNSHTTASLRGLSAVDAHVAWASGTGGTFLRTTDGGATWTAAHVPGADDQDFRGVRAFDAASAVLMSKSRIYLTRDGGAHWALAFTHPDPKGFLDSIAFWDRANGIVLGDALDGSPDVRVTGDGGLHWQRRATPPALPNEGSFAASNTCLFLAGSAEVWFVTGGTGAARVFHSRDRGATWTVAATPVRNDSPSAGIFSIAFDGPRGIVVGGDYARDRESRGNIALSTDGGRTWTAPAVGPQGFRSAVAWVPELKLWVAAGTSGSDVSNDGGRSWRQFDGGSYNALSFVPGGAGWAAGAGGRIARFQAADR